MSFRHAVLLPLAVCLAGCAPGGAIKPSRPPAAEAARTSLEVMAGEPAPRAERVKTGVPAAARREDDFIEVDDKKGLLKTWPMALFLALLAVMAGTL